MKENQITKKEIKEMFAQNAKQITEQVTKQVSVLITERIEGSIEALARMTQKGFDEMHTMHKELKAELKSEIGSVRSELREFKADMNEFRNEMNGFKNESIKKTDRLGNRTDDHEVRLSKLEETAA